MGVYLFSLYETEIEILYMANLQNLAEAIHTKLANICPISIGITKEQTDNRYIDPQLFLIWHDFYDLSETCS